MRRAARLASRLARRGRAPLCRTQADEQARASKRASKRTARQRTAARAAKRAAARAAAFGGEWFSIEPPGRELLGSVHIADPTAAVAAESWYGTQWVQQGRGAGARARARPRARARARAQRHRLFNVTVGDDGVLRAEWQRSASSLGDEDNGPPFDASGRPRARMISGTCAFALLPGRQVRVPFPPDITRDCSPSLSNLTMDCTIKTPLLFNATLLPLYIQFHERLPVMLPCNGRLRKAGGRRVRACASRGDCRAPCRARGPRGGRWRTRRAPRRTSRR